MPSRLVGSSIDFLQQHPLVRRSRIVRFFWDHLDNLQGFYYDHRRLPNSIALENTTACNRRCPYCPHFWQTRPRKDMSGSLLRKIVQDLSDLNYKGSIVFAPFGEPLLDDRLPFFVDHIKKELRTCTVTVLTNGDLLTLERFRRLAGSGVDFFAISDHFDVHEDRYVMAEPIAAVETFLALSENDRSRMIFYDGNYEKIRKIDRFHDRCGLIVLEDIVSQQTLFKNCLFHEGAMGVNYRGEILLCCRQWTTVPVFGRVGEEHIGDIWKKRAFRRIRKNLRKGVFELELCRNCGHGFMPDPSHIKELSASHRSRT